MLQDSDLAVLAWRRRETLRYRTLGRTGLRVSEVGCGSATLGLTDYIERWDARSDAAALQGAAALERALDLGYNYLDTAASYGDGRAEEILGPVVARRRHELFLATKTRWKNWSEREVTAEAEACLRRLRTDYVDVLQFHGGDYKPEDFRHIMEGGPFAAYDRLRGAGKVRFLGITAEEPVTLRPFLATGRFDVVQIRYNIIHQNPWHEFLEEATRADVGVVVMRPLTSGVFQRLMAAACPGIERSYDLSAVALNFVLSDPRVSTAIVGLRRPEEAERNAALSDAVVGRLDLRRIHERYVRV
jgi:aryl-alcohol dehydrogenase-like predicted oxidoreductase